MNILGVIRRCNRASPFPYTSPTMGHFDYVAGFTPTCSFRAREPRTVGKVLGETFVACDGTLWGGKRHRGSLKESHVSLVAKGNRTKIRSEKCSKKPRNMHAFGAAKNRSF